MKRLIVFLIVCSVIFAMNGIAVGDESDVDVRLYQPVTIQCKDVRLHTALEQLSELTGVTLYSGRNGKDWQVRDIPVIVCAKDIPLGKLLRAIADVTHLDLTSNTRDGVKSYRIWRDAASSKELADYWDKKIAWGFEEATWEWDALSKFNDLSDAAFNMIHDDHTRNQLSDFKAVSPILAALGQESCKDVLAGETIRITAKDASEELKPLIDSCLRNSWEAYYREWSTRIPNLRTPTDEDYSNAALVIECTNLSEDESPSITIRREGRVSKSTTFLCNARFLAFLLEDYLPKEPEDPKPPRGLEFNPLSPIWDTMITLKMPEKKEPITFGDLCAAVSEATGYSIVAENWHGHQEYMQPQPRRIFERFKTEASLINIIGLDQRLQWRADENNKLLLCCVERWPTCQASLVPEQLVEGLKQKLDGDGVYLEDVIPLACLSKTQLVDWFQISADTNMHMLYVIALDERKLLWAFYGSLSDYAKAKVKSDSGLRLSSKDVERLAIAFSALESGEQTSRIIGKNTKLWEPGSVWKVENPVLRLKTIETHDSDGLTCYSYTFEFSGKLGLEEFAITIPMFGTYPIYSEKGKTRLLEAKQKQEPNSQTKAY